ncbi:TnsA-like heteromeric transposase endonuclease subunit [Nocardia abscessus]|nr:TnsA-like heteromeric transposase endonuclease subunit [Nocardia abscessus]
MRQIGENSVRRVGRLLLLDSGSVVGMNETRYIPTGFGASRSDDVLVRYRNSDGRFVDATMAQLPVEDVLAGLPVREFRSYKGRRHYSGWYWSSTTGTHLVYESRLELARLLVADQDSTVVAIAAQPFLLEGSDGVRVRRHVPDLLLARADGTVTVVDVKAPSRVADPKVAAQFAWTEKLCALRGFGFEVWTGMDAVELENLRFLAGYRRESTVCRELIAPVLESAAEPVSLAVLERGLAGLAVSSLVRPVALHLLWRSRMRADLRCPLDADTVVSVGAAA